MVHRYCERFRIFRTLRRCRLGSYLFSRRKSFTHSSSRTAYALYEWAGIPGTLLCGWMSDKLFKDVVHLLVFYLWLVYLSQFLFTG